MSDSGDAKFDVLGMTLRDMITASNEIKSELEKRGSKSVAFLNFYTPFLEELAEKREETNRLRTALEEIEVLPYIDLSKAVGIACNALYGEDGKP